MSGTVYGRVTKPHHCAWVLGLPATKDDFYASQERSTAQYTKRFWHWPEYCREFLDDYTPLRELLLRLGVRLIENASIEDFRDVWLCNVDAVVLFSHWTENGIEFRNGEVPSDDVACSIPTATIGVLDLCVCHPIPLALLLEATHPHLIKKQIWKLADPKFWCMFYTVLFKYLATSETSYPDAIDRVASALSAKGEGH